MLQFRIVLACIPIRTTSFSGFSVCLFYFLGQSVRPIFAILPAFSRSVCSYFYLGRRLVRPIFPILPCFVTVSCLLGGVGYFPEFPYRSENVCVFRILRCGFRTRYNRFLLLGCLSCAWVLHGFPKVFFDFDLGYLMVRETVMMSGR